MIRVKGVADARKALEAVSAAIPELNEKTLDEAGKMALQLARSRTPVRTGRLAAGHRMRKVSGNAVELYSEVEYAHAVEYGGSASEPQPHWRPALEAAKKEFARIYAGHAEKAVK